jgi:hypothetical protein
MADNFVPQTYKEKTAGGAAPAIDLSQNKIGLWGVKRRVKALPCWPCQPLFQRHHHTELLFKRRYIRRADNAIVYQRRDLAKKVFCANSSSGKR